VALDVGANIGTHCVFFAKKVSPGGLVYAFEPQRLVFQNLCANLALNGLTNVLASPVAVGDQAGHVSVPVFDPEMPMNFGSVTVSRNGPGEMTSLIRLDDLNVPACHLIKVDVEGMEADVLRGAASTIARFKPILLVEQANSREVTDLLLRAGYFVYWHVEEYFNPRNHFGNRENVILRYGQQWNLLCVPRPELAAGTGLEPLLGPDDSRDQALSRLRKRLKR
jgi:FkbM family methyltransferase